VHAQSVIRELAKAGESDVRLVDLRDVPQRASVTMAFSNAHGSGFELAIGNGPPVRLDAVQSFWWRRPQTFVLPGGMDANSQHFALTELSTAFQGLWQCTTGLWINDPVRDSAAAHKPWQLETARDVGLAIPDTLMTTDPEKVRAFWESRRGEVIYKPFLQTFHSWRETRQLKREELALLDSVRLAPVIFQSLVPGAADLRVTIIGDEIFPAAVDIDKMEYKLDVRLNQQAYERHQLPADVGARLLELMRRLGLEYGAIDLRLTPDGEYVFFEVNPAGQFLFVEHACGLPISAALAARLAAGREGSVDALAA
jgi:glutathione synthase/RimK-type ligase-like ATP-grasp enzyme